MCPDFFEQSCPALICSVVDELGIPIKFVGVGEPVDDLQTFDAQVGPSALVFLRRYYDSGAIFKSLAIQAQTLQQTQTQTVAHAVPCDWRAS